MFYCNLVYRIEYSGELMAKQNTLLLDTLCEAFEKMDCFGISPGKVALLANVGRMTVWRAKNRPETISISVAQRIVNAINKIPNMPYEFKKAQHDRR